MIFSPELTRRIRQGLKTQTRRPVKRTRLDQPAVPCRYREGKSYAVQPGRGQSATCRIHVTDVRQEKVGEIAFADARAEGFPTTEDFKAYWIAVHEKAWLKYEHEMLDEAENDDGVVLDRDTWILRRSLDLFERRHASRPVWVITFRLDVAPVGRLLALRSQEGYTSNPARAMQGEPEAVDAETQRRLTEAAGTRTSEWLATEAKRRDMDRALLSREDQIVRLRRAARLRSVDASREIWALEKMLGTATDGNFVAKVQKAEAKVFQAAA